MRLVTTDLQVEVATRPLRIAFLDRHGDWLLREPAEAGMSAEPVGDGSGRVRLRASLAFSGEQHFYGLGQGGGGLDRLGVTRQLWNTHIGHGPGSDMGVPLLVSSRGHALFFDNPGDAVIAVGRSDAGVRIVYTAETGTLAWYFLLGGDLRGAMREVAELLGRPPLPPRWALGFLQSTRHFRRHGGAAAVAPHPPREADPLRRDDLPLDATARPSAGTGAWAISSSSPSCGRIRRALLEEMRAQHFEVITHEYPVLHEESPLFAEAESRGYLLAEGYERASATGANYRQGQRYVDFSNPAARAWWWSAHRQLAALGVAGWWLDGGEGPPAGSTLHGGSGRLLHNIYDRLSPRGLRRGGGAPIGPISACSCSAGRGPRACSGSARRAGRATSTTTSRPWRRRSRSG